MQRTEAQHKETHNPPAQRQGCGKALESPQREQIAQLDVVVESSPQGGKMAQLASMANASPQVAAQRRLMDMIQNSPRMAAQRKAIDAIHTSPHVTAQRQQLDSFTAKPAQLQETEEETLQPKVAQREEAPAKPNNTGLPDNLKHGIESLSGLSMDNVKVHYNSSQPAQLNALAYAQGTDIHVAPGQEKHLPHEAWHVVQQAQGRVQPTTQMKSGVPINDDAGLEREADVMGGRAVSIGLARGKSMESDPVEPIDLNTGSHSVQLVSDDEDEKLKKMKERLELFYVSAGNALRLVDVDEFDNTYLKKINMLRFVAQGLAAKIGSGQGGSYDVIRGEYKDFRKLREEEEEAIAYLKQTAEQAKKTQAERMQAEAQSSASSSDVVKIINQKKDEIRERNDQAIRNVLLQVRNVRRVPGQEHFDAGRNPGIPEIPGGQDNPLRLEVGEEALGLSLGTATKNFKLQESDSAPMKYRSSDSPNILVHVARKSD